MTSNTFSSYTEKIAQIGFTKVDDLLQLESMQRYTKEDLLAEVEKLTVWQEEI